MSGFERLMRMYVQNGWSAVELSKRDDLVHFCVRQTDDSEESEFFLPMKIEEAAALGEALIAMAGNGEGVMK